MPRRKQSSSSEEEEDDDESRTNKRQKFEEDDVEDRLESLIERVGSKGTQSLESNLEGLASVLDADLVNYKYKILEILINCVTSYPDRVCVYTTLVGLLNVKNSSCGGELVEQLVKRLKECLKLCQFVSSRLIVKFIADLGNCRVVSLDSLLSLFDSFVEVTLEDNIPQVRSDHYVHCVLSSLPLIGQKLHLECKASLIRLLSGIRSYMQKRDRAHVSILRVWESNEPHPQEDSLDVLWAAVQALEQQSWVERCLVRPYLAFESVFEDCSTSPHSIPKILPPSHDPDKADYPLPSVVFRMFDYTDAGETSGLLPGAHSPERYVTEELITTILDVYQNDRKVAAQQLCNLLIKLRLPTSYMVVEVIFGVLTRLPVCPYLEIYLGSLLIELCREQPNTMPQVLAQASEMLYERLPTMKVGCADRFINWFSYHLSNFKYQWSWDDWAGCIQDEPGTMRHHFIKETLLKLLRFTYLANLQQVLPEVYKSVIPAAQESHFKYEAKPGANSSANPQTFTAHKLMTAIKAKCTNEDAHNILKESLGAENAATGYGPAQVDVFFNVLFNLGNKSFSHSFAALSKFHTLCRVLTGTPEGQAQVLKTLYEVWVNHQQMILVLVDKMMKLQLLDPVNMAHWVFSPEMEQELTSLFVWEMVHNGLVKVARHASRLGKEVEEATDRWEVYQAKVRDGFDLDTEVDVPTRDQLERMTERLQEARADLKNLMLVLVRGLIAALQKEDAGSPRFRQLKGRLEDLLLRHHDEVFRLVDAVETEIIKGEVHVLVRKVFQDFLTLRA